MRRRLFALAVFTIPAFLVALSAPAIGKASENPDIVVLKHGAKAKEVSARHSKRYGFDFALNLVRYLRG